MDAPPFTHVCPHFELRFTSTAACKERRKNAKNDLLLVGREQCMNCKGPQEIPPWLVPGAEFKEVEDEMDKQDAPGQGAQGQATPLGPDLADTPIPLFSKALSPLPGDVVQLVDLGDAVQITVGKTDPKGRRNQAQLVADPKAARCLAVLLRDWAGMQWKREAGQEVARLRAMLAELEAA